jgi:anthranilate phosphoribosyltransferase
VAGDLLEAAFGEIMDGQADPLVAAGLLVALRTKGETVGELVAAARAMRSRATPAPIPHGDAIDTCGTGGDGLHTFNISTTAAFVAAGAGVAVAKHGNRAASSRSGSFDVLEALGVEPDLSIDDACAVFERVGISFFYARRAHPAMRHLAPIREALRMRTVMNCLGPLLNPLGVKRQLVGVYTEGLVEAIATALGALGAERALVVHGVDGLDELSTTGPSVVARLDAGRVEVGRVDPEELGLARATLPDLEGGDPARNAELLRAVLASETGAPRDIVVLNAGAALWVAGIVEDLASGMEAARGSIDSGAAREKLDALVEETRRFS